MARSFSCNSIKEDDICTPIAKWTPFVSNHKEGENCVFKSKIAVNL